MLKKQAEKQLFIILKMHQKHTNLQRRNNGNFAPNEVAFVGTKCGVILNLVQQIAKKLPNYKLAYFDASHEKEVSKNSLSEFVFHPEGNLQILTSQKVNAYQQRILFSQFDLVFINGNHYQAIQQVLILDEEKEASVLKRIDQLHNIQCIIKLTKETSLFGFLEEKYPQIQSTVSYTIDEIDTITHHIESLIQEKIPTVKGLVLVGGKSTRMGTDKSKLNYFGKPQREHAKDLLEENGLETYFSVANFSENPKEIHDTFLNLGAFGGICSAFQKDPNSALLVLATDVPFVNPSLIKHLLEKRNPSKVATAIKGKNKEFPEPLITIYEPKAYPILLQYLAQGYSCARKMLINNDVETIEVDDDLIKNINTKEAFEWAKKELSKATK